MSLAFLKKIKNNIVAKRREKECLRKRKRLVNHAPTIISSNCIGGIILHDLALRFNTPTINLYFEPDDFLLFAQNLEAYTACELSECADKDVSYPVGILKNSFGTVKIFFVHYHSFEEAKLKWEQRCKRIDYDNLFIMLEAPVMPDERFLSSFDTLRAKNKVILTNSVHPKYPFTYRLDIYDENYFSGKTIEFSGRFAAKRYLDAFDYVSFLNSGKIHR